MDELALPGGRGDPVGVLAAGGPLGRDVAGIDAVGFLVFGPGPQVPLPVLRVAQPARLADLMGRPVADDVGIPGAAPPPFALRRPLHPAQLGVEHVLAQDVRPVVVHLADQRVRAVEVRQVGVEPRLV